MDLKSKLGLYKENSIKKASSDPVLVDKIQDFIPGAICTNEAGSFYCVETRHPVGSIHGGCCLGAALQLSSQSLARLCPEYDAGSIAADKLLFLDTETTGLSGGAGTVAFLVGIGYFEQRQQSPISSAGRFPVEKAVSGETQSSRTHGRAAGNTCDQPSDVVQTPRVSGARRYSLRELVPDSFRYKRLTKFKEFFVIRQFFMRDYDEEAAMLLELNRLLPKFEALVTFNGKSFDWNLLQGRFISNRIRPALSSPVHIDLLFPSRRIWGLKLESCRLSSLEENILGEKRTDDIPGFMIPAVYFKYLEDRDATDIKKVVKHNELDILSMVSLIIKISSMLENPGSESACEQEMLGMGKIFQKSGEKDNVIYCYEFCAKSENFPVKAAAVKHLTGIYKRSGNYAKALEHWKNMLERSSGFYLFPMIEMAMYYEHKEKNAAKALEIIEKAVELSLQAGLREEPCFAELRKRHDRLKKKTVKISNIL